MPRRKPSAAVVGRLTALEEIHKKHTMEKISLRETLKKQLEEGLKDRLLQKSRAANEALAIGALHSEIREIIGLGNWTGYKEFLALTEDAVQVEGVAAEAQEAARKTWTIENLNLRPKEDWNIKVTEVGSIRLVQWYLTFTRVLNPGPGVPTHYIEPLGDRNGNRTGECRRYIEQNYAELYEAIQTARLELIERGDQERREAAVEKADREAKIAESFAAIPEGEKFEW